MLYYYYRIALVGKPAEHSQQGFYICKMQACRGFVQNIKRASGTFAEKLRREFHSLAFSSGKRHGRLS